MKSSNYKIFTPFLLLSLIFPLFTIFAPVSLTQLALAVTGNYNRDPANIADKPLTISDWNKLDDDFLLRDGSNFMQGNLNLNSNRITNLSSPDYPPSLPAEATQAANVKYVADAISGSGMTGSGGIYTNWGSPNCPASATKLYTGYGFSAPYDKNAGGSNPICMQAGDAGDADGSITADSMLPLITGGDASLPTNSVDPSSTITGNRMVKCAVCFNGGGVCYTHYGSHTCGGGFDNTTKGYKGYVLGSFTSNNFDSYSNPTQRECVNSDFDAGTASSGSLGAMWFGTFIVNNFGLGYTPKAFVKCSVCCK